MLAGVMLSDHDAVQTRQLISVKLKVTIVKSFIK
jgi:hypothetical protein